LHETLLLSLDDLLAVTHEFVHPQVSRSGLDRCLRRHGVSNLETLLPKEEGTKTPVNLPSEDLYTFVVQTCLPSCRGMNQFFPVGELGSNEEPDGSKCVGQVAVCLSGWRPVAGTRC